MREEAVLAFDPEDTSEDATDLRYMPSEDTVSAMLALLVASSVVGAIWSVFLISVPLVCEQFKCGSLLTLRRDGALLWPPTRGGMKGSQGDVSLWYHRAHIRVSSTFHRLLTDHSGAFQHPNLPSGKPEVSVNVGRDVLGSFNFRFTFSFHIDRSRPAASRKPGSHD